MLDKAKINRAINYIVLLYAFSIPLSRAAIVVFTALLFLLWILEGGFKEKFKKIFECKFTISLTLFFLFTLISILWTETDNISEALNYIKKYWYLLSIFPILTSLKPEYILKLLNAFLAGMAVSMILSYGIYFQWWQIDEVTAGSLSPFMYHVFYSIFLSFSALVALSLSFNSKYRALYLILSGLFVGVLFLGIGRTGQVIFVVGLFILILQNFRSKMRLSTIFIISISLLFLMLYQFNSTFKNRVSLIKSDIVHMVEHDEYCNSLGGRVITWKISYDIVKEHPIIGMGVGDHIEYLKEKMDSSDKFSTCSIKGMISYFHGQYIEIVSQIGILGLILFLSIFYFLFKVELRDRGINNIKIILLVTFLLAFIVDVPFRKQFSLALFALISGIIIREKSVENGKL